MAFQAIGAFAGAMLSSALKASSNRSNSENDFWNEVNLMNHNYNLNESSANNSFWRTVDLMKNEAAWNDYFVNKQYDQNLDLMNRSNAFQELMSNTAHQREMADLKAAGLNPILAANSGAYNSFGSSASVGQGSVSAGSANAQSLSHNGVKTNPTDFDFNGVMQFYNDSKRLKNETSLAKENVKQIQSQVRFNDSNTALAWEQAKTEMNKQQQIKQDIANSIKQTDADVYAKIKNADSGYITANANATNASTNSARLKHEQVQYNESTEKGMYEFSKRHPKLAGFNKGANMIVQPFANALPTFGVRVNTK